MKPISQTSKIWLTVAFIHLFGLFFLSSSSTKIKSPPKKLVVVTKVFTPKIVTPTPVIPNLVTKIEKKAPLPPPKKVTPVKKAPLPQKPKPTQKTSKQVLKKIDQRLSKPLPAPPPKIAEPALPSYIDSACQIFTDTLFLPEKGGVKLTLTILPTGRIGKIELETSASQKNLDYLMTILPTLILPAPDKGHETTFTVLFCND